jgi:hypothetical protein
MKLLHFDKSYCCLVCLKLFRRNDILALHMLKHNIIELKVLGLHPKLLRRVA